MTDNTNDPVGVLISALEKLAAQDSGIVASSAKSDCMAATAKAALRNYNAAAIQHSEQRETVPAGEDFDGLRKLAEAATPGPWVQFNKKAPYVKAIGHDSYLLHTMPIGEAAADCHPDTRARWLRDAAYIAAANPAAILRLLDRLAAPVAAPVPEAKAEQVTDDPYMRVFGVSSVAAPAVKHEAPACNPMGGEMRAHKHEASELPPTWQARTVLRRNQPLTKAGMSEVMSAMEGEIKDLRASQSAPPIAAQGSEDARTLERWWLKADGISDTFVRLSDVEKLLDSRSPVVAAPEDVRKAALEEAIQACGAVGAKADTSVTTAFDCIDAIRALSAAAPSADAKGAQ